MVKNCDRGLENILPSRKTRYIYEKLQRQLGCARRLTKALPWPVGRDRKLLFF